MNPAILQLAASISLFAAVFVFVAYAWESFLDILRQRERRYERVLNHQLLIDIDPRMVLAIVALCALAGGLLCYVIEGNIFWFVGGAVAGCFVPDIIIRHLEQKRRERLELQLIDGITTLSSGVRAGLTLVQAMELLVLNGAGPIKQEFAQLLREYQMGLDLNQAMHNTAQRIDSSNYRLLFTAVEMHRMRGGDTGESLDRICDSIRELQRLEGKLDAVTAQGRYQAWAMGAMPVLFLLMLYGIDPEGVGLLFSEPVGRVMLLIACGLIVLGFFWIRKIMTVDI